MEEEKVQFATEKANEGGEIAVTNLAPPPTHMNRRRGEGSFLMQAELLRMGTPATGVKSCKCYASKGHRNCGKIYVNISCILVI